METGRLETKKKKEELQTAISRIQRMEGYLDELLRASATDRQVVYEDAELQEKLSALTEYYENGQWLQDYDRDARGELPKDLKRGILAQDTLYDFIFSLQFKDF